MIISYVLMSVRSGQGLYADGTLCFIAVYTSAVGGEFATAVVFACCWPTMVELYKGLGGDKDEEFRPIPW